jgi:regulator of RNase E activity RraA
VRDVATLATWPDFSVFSRSIAAEGPTSAERGQVNAPIVIGGQRVAPGDLIIGDDDGLVVLAPSLVRTRIGDAEQKLARERKWIASLESGRSVIETLGLPPA